MQQRRVHYYKINEIIPRGCVDRGKGSSWTAYIYSRPFPIAQNKTPSTSFDHIGVIIALKDNNINVSVVKNLFGAVPESAATLSAITRILTGVRLLWNC